MIGNNLSKNIVFHSSYLLYTYSLRGHMNANKNQSSDAMMFYKSSWFNKAMGFVNSRKVPVWLLIPMVTLSLFLIAVVINSFSSQNDPFQFSPVVYLTFIQIAYILLLINFLDQRARMALMEFRPVLNLKEEDYPLIEKRLTVLPAKTVNYISIGAIAFFSIWWYLMYRFGSGISPESEFAQYANEFTKTPIGIYSFIIFGFLWLINLT